MAGESKRQCINANAARLVTHPDFAKSLIGPLFACGGKRAKYLIYLNVI